MRSATGNKRYHSSLQELGHLQRLEAIDKALKPLPGLHLRANWRDGISVADCIQNGYELAQELSE
ncbi:MAG: oxygen-dependent protoporphyrinogen oxidase [Motiliproteus sp.]|jgi:oxygen-dependent protoporphyrinogen oxidase